MSEAEKKVESPDPDATVRADFVPEAPEDPDATVLSDAAQTRAVTPDDLPTVAVPAAEDPTVPSADGIDTLDDPYYAPVVPDDLTEAHQVVSIPSPVESLPERRRRLPRWAIVLLVIVALAAAGAGAYYTYEQELWGGKTVPSVVGMTQEEATQALEALGFSVEVVARTTDGNFGTVLACDPAPGRRVNPADGATITVAAERTIPEVVGLDVDAARQALIDAGATNIQITYRNSDQAVGTVLSVEPEEGSAFVSSDQITLTVARAYTVPNVEGMTLSDAQATLESEGLQYSVTYVESTVEKNIVVSVSPAVGSVVEAGATVELSVSSPYPSSALYLLEYFDSSPEELSSFLADQDFTLRYGGTYAASGNAHAIYENPDGDVLQISDDPEVSSTTGSSQADVLASGAGIGGVRYAFSSSTVPGGGTSESESGLRAVMEACGFDGLLDMCTQDNVSLPDGTVSSEEIDETDDEDADATDTATTDDIHFICGYGREGDYTWAVIIGGREGSTHVIALVAPTSHFDAIDLGDFGGSVCDYIAYADLYAE